MVYRHQSQPRKDWLKKVVSQGLTYALTKRPDGTSVPYWNENSFYEFSMAQIEELETVTEKLYDMCIEAARFMLTGEMGNLGLTPGALELAWHSFESPKLRPSLYSRFDLRYDGFGPAKLLELNGQTPTLLVESAVTQWQWLQDLMPACDQWNSIHERLVMQWGKMGLNKDIPLYFSHFQVRPEDEDGEDFMNVTYLRDTAYQAGFLTQGLPVQDIGWNDDTKEFVDMRWLPIKQAFMLYPWENALREEYGRHFMEYPDEVQWIEPVWKVVLSNKAMLAALWYLFPDCENLLPAYLDKPRGMEEWIAKPLHGREGSGMKWRTKDGEFASSAQEWGDEGYCYQQWCELPQVDGNYYMLGSWIVGDRSAGMLVRESDSPVTDYYARVVPHIINAPAPTEAEAKAWLLETRS